MAYKMKGAPMMDTSKKHGTNANYKKSGMNDKDGAPLKAGAPGLLGNLMDPLGLKKRIGGLFGKGGGKPCPPPAAAAAPAGAPPVAAPIDPDMQAGAVAPQDPNAMQDPNAAAINPMTKKKGAPKLKGNQHKLDMNKNGKIDAEDFKALKKGPTKKYKY